MMKNQNYGKIDSNKNRKSTSDLNHRDL